jgi:hypothetical protein
VPADIIAADIKILRQILNLIRIDNGLPEVLDFRPPSTNYSAKGLNKIIEILLKHFTSEEVIY